MRAVIVIIGSRRNQFDRIRAEHRQITVVLFPLLNIPSVVGIRLRAIPQLVSAQRGFRSRDFAEIRRDSDSTTRHPQFTQQPPYPEQNTSFIVPQHGNQRTVSGRRDLITFRATEFRSRRRNDFFRVHQRPDF